MDVAGHKKNTLVCFVWATFVKSSISHDIIPKTYDDPVLVESEAEFKEIDSDNSIEEVDGNASLSENEDNDYVGEEENN